MRSAGLEHWSVLPLPGLYVSDFGAQYSHRRHEVLLFEYVRGPRADELGLPVFAGGSAAAGAAEQAQASGSEEAWWLVVTKCSGDEHVPMGCCSFRVCVDVEPLLLSTGPEAGVSGEGRGVAGGQDKCCQFRGSGMLAMRGFHNAGFVPGILATLRNGDVWLSFGHTVVAHDQDAVVACPCWERAGEFVGQGWEPRLNGRNELRCNSAHLLRQRAGLLDAHGPLRDQGHYSIQNQIQAMDTWLPGMSALDGEQHG